MTTYELGNTRLVPVPAAEFSPAWLTDGVVRWVRLTSSMDGERQAWLQTLGVPANLVQQADADSRPVVAHEQALLVSLPVLTTGESGTRRVRLLCTANLLLTIEDGAVPAIDTTVAELCAGKAPPEATGPGLLLDVLEGAARGTGPAYLSLRRGLDALAEALEARPLDVPSESLLGMKRLISQMAMLFEEQGHCLAELQRRLAIGLQSERGRDQLRGLITDLERGLRLLARMEDRVRDLRQHHLHSQQETTSRRLNVLAVLSAIYLPATLIAGIYGMNFEHIPMTEFHNGYLMVMAVMAALVGAQVWYFYRRGWFE